MSGQNRTTSVPTAVRPVFDEIVTVTDAFCRRHLDEEYAALGAKLAAKLARKRPSPLVRGDRGIWAAGIIYAVGRVNFLADSEQVPHMRTDRMADLLGVKQATMANKGRLIMDTLNIGLMDPEFSRRAIVDQNPMTWLLEIDGLLVDARRVPEAVQVDAWRRGLIPYVPMQGAKRRQRGTRPQIVAPSRVPRPTPCHRGPNPPSPTTPSRPRNPRTSTANWDVIGFQAVERPIPGHHFGQDHDEPTRPAFWLSQRSSR